MKLLATLAISYVMGYIWELIELIAYGEIQARKVDDIMLVLYMPFVYLAVERIFGR